MVSIRGFFGAFVIVVIGLALAPTVFDMGVGDGAGGALNGTTYTLTQLVPVMYSIGVLGAAVAVGVFA